VTGGAGGAGGAEIVVDARGRRCPIPVIELAKAVPDAPLGAILAVLADDPAAASDIPAWCRLRDQSYLGSHDLPDGSGTTYRVRRAT
jgi:TusA-related sulfurtransferase